MINFINNLLYKLFKKQIWFRAQSIVNRACYYETNDFTLSDIKQYGKRDNYKLWFTLW